jgi:NAD(P) transhydrogenase subunit alpha
MNIGIVKEDRHSESRVSLTPESISKLTKLGNHKFSIVKDAGTKSGFENKEYQDSGAQIIENNKQLILKNQLIISVNPIKNSYYKHFSTQSILISNFETFSDTKCIQLLIQNNITGLALERIPRIARAQSMDVLSSQASVSGYKSVLIAASKLNKYFPMLMTAAGTIPPAKILVLGAGVAGLQAIATAKRLGASVTAFDIRKEVREQVESLGAKFLEMPNQEDSQEKSGYAKEQSLEKIKSTTDFLHPALIQSDSIITTAMIPGKKSPILINQKSVENMKKGTVIIDLAAERGGNCELTETDKTIVHNGVLIVGTLNLPSTMPYHASQLLSKNVESLLNLLLEEEVINLNFEDEIINDICLTHNKNDRHKLNTLKE